MHHNSRHFTLYILWPGCSSWARSETRIPKEQNKIKNNWNIIK